jgi:hypothetical protein
MLINSAQFSLGLKSHQQRNMKTKLSNITIVLTITSILLLTGCSRSRAPEDKPVSGDELTTLKREYADVLALQGTSKGEILAIARILRANPEMVIDRTAASGEYCFKSGLGTMVHFATQPQRTSEGVLYEFDASGLIAAGLDPARMKRLPELGRMTPGLWYFLPKGQLDPHHAHAMPGPTIAIAVNVK